MEEKAALSARGRKAKQPPSKKDIYKEVQRYNRIIDDILGSDLPDKMEIARIVDLHKKAYEDKHHFIGK